MRFLSVAACGAALTLAVGLAAPAAAQPSEQVVRVNVPDTAARHRLAALDLDLVSGPGWTDVLLHGSADATRLRKAGFSWNVRNTAKVATVSTPLPSGRTSYRTLADYETDLGILAREHPGKVRRITLPYRTLEGRRVHGIEIGHHINARDGRPVFLMMGLHHSREWPSGEMTMEFGYDLLKNDGRDRRITDLLDRARVILVPVVNPDGFDQSRSGPFENKRKNCRIIDGQDAPPPLCSQPENAQLGVDINRNYGFGWGGTGSSADKTKSDYHGAGPFSEPEVRNIRDLVTTRQVTTLITNHTYGGTILRPYFTKAEGDTPDEPAYKTLSDQMSAQNGYTGMKSGDDYETTGETNDWSYYATRGLGYTFEFGKEGFHPAYESIAGEYYGTGQYAGKGSRGAFLLALENAASPHAHSVIRGHAPTGATLRITKKFTLWTSPWTKADGTTGAPLPVPTTLSSTMVVGPGGHFTWDVNPSVRPQSPFTPTGESPVTGLIRESWTLTCTPRNHTHGTTIKVTVDKAQTATVNLARCR